VIKSNFETVRNVRWGAILESSGGWRWRFRYVLHKFWRNVRI